MGDGLWTRANVLLRPACVRGARCCRRNGARIPQARSMDAALVLREHPRKLRLLAVGGLWCVDRDHHRAVPSVPLVRRPEEAAQGLVAWISVSSIPTR